MFSSSALVARPFHLLLLISLLWPGPAQAQTEPPPYLYYYSDVLNAFIIERADGSESRILAEGVMPEDTNEVRGASWSPSGQWIAWSSAHVSALAGDRDYAGWIISADGQERPALLDDMVYIRDLVWSPLDDLLFVAAHLSQDSTRYFRLLDLTTRQMVASFELAGVDQGMHLVGSSEPVWAPDGQHVLFFYQTWDSVDDELIYQAFLRKVATDGSYSDVPISVVSVHRDHWWTNPDISSQGWLAYLTPENTRLVVENLSDGRQIWFDDWDADVSNIMLVWNPDGVHAFIYVHSPCDEQCPPGPVWLLSTETQTLERLSGRARDVSVSESETKGNVPPSLLYWSPDGSRGAFLTDDGRLNLMDIADPPVFAVVDVPQISGWRWAGDSAHVMIATDSEHPDYLYDLRLGQWQALGDLKPSYAYRYGLASPGMASPDGRYFALYSERSLLEVRSGEKVNVTYLPHNGAAYVELYSGPTTYNYNWHPGAGWLLTEQTVYFAGGGGGPTATTVTTIDGGFQRDLTSSLSRADWLPEKVIPYLAPARSTPPLQQPAITLRDCYVNGVAWSPDGEQLAASCAGDRLHIWRVDDVSAQQISAFQTSHSCDNHDTHRCELSWSPDGAQVAAQGENTIQVWNVASGEVVAELEGRVLTWQPPPDNYIVSDVLEAYSPDGRRVARFLPDSGQEVAAVPSGEIVFRRRDIRWAYALQWMPDSRWLALADGEQIELWNTVTLRRIHLEHSENAVPVAMDISPDGRWIASACFCTKIHIWDAATGALVKRLNWHALVVEFSPDSRRLAAGNGGFVTIWNVSDFSETR